ncbi:MAG TPA: ribosome biogenesis GTPase Der [Acidobacteriota bacterium]|nr:ribosome biogenesis GTPase Der [Acidobacteriota bacterium]
MLRIAILGRPNVGKSTLFNRLCRTRKAIVGDEPGITRDRIYGSVSIGGRTVELLDTGGMMPQVTDVIPVKILEQVEAAIAESDVLLLVVDGRAGITPADEQLLPMLRRSGKPLWVVVNKLDTPEMESYAAPFYSIGAEEVFPVSAEHDRGLGSILDALAARAAEHAPAEEQAAPEAISVAVVGRPNVGKSSLVNRLLGVQRSIVSELPGTTRDSIDTLLERDGVRYRIIDTAGIRRRGKTDERTERVSVIMARKNLERAEVALLLLDAEEGVTKLDAAIGGYACDSGCSVIIVLNKWDKVDKQVQSVEEFSDAVRRRTKYLTYAPILTISALTGQRVSRLFEMINKAHAARLLRVPTSVLNNTFVPDVAGRIAASNPYQKLGIRYITQVSCSPPTFLVFTAGKERIHFSTERFLINQLRENFGFYAAPIRVEQRTKRPRGRTAASTGD